MKIDVNAAAEKRMKQNIKKLAPAEWPKTSDEESLWLIDMIAPHGGLEEAVKNLKDDVLDLQTVKTLQPGPAGGMAVVEW